MKNTQKLKIIVVFFCILLSFILAIYITGFLDFILSNQLNMAVIRNFQYDFFTILAGLFLDKNKLLLFLCIFVLIAMGMYALVILSQKKGYETDTIPITKNITVPIVAGQGQHGTAQWMKEEQFTVHFSEMILNYKSGTYQLAKPVIKGGLMVHGIKKGNKEHFYYLDGDMHSAVIGATRSGKSRRIVVESIMITGYSGESMVISDPKGELYGYTAPYLKTLGYQVIDLDFNQPQKSARYNLLQPIVNAVNRNDYKAAVELVWDITNNLVGSNHNENSEKIWQNGEESIIAGSIMAVVFDNKDHPEYQNMANVYHFINSMTSTDNTGKMPLEKYLKMLEQNQPDHPARAIFGIAMVAPSRTRGSFFTSALTTLRLFTNQNTAAQTSSSDFNLEDIGMKKVAVFILLPDAKEAYWSIAALIVSQIYQVLIDIAYKNGGRLKNRVEFFLDEFGNFTKIGSFGSMITAGGGRGIRFHLYLQAFSQLEDKYGKTASETIKDNCHAWVYLKTANHETATVISKRLGQYTTTSYSKSSSYQGLGKQGSSSSSVQLMARYLLTEDEVIRVEHPYAIVMVIGLFPAMVKLPDLSMWRFNDILGLGNEEHNRQVLSEREQIRQTRIIEKMPVWGIEDMLNNRLRVDNDLSVYDMENASRRAEEIKKRKEMMDIYKKQYNYGRQEAMATSNGYYYPTGMESALYDDYYDDQYKYNREDDD